MKAETRRGGHYSPRPLAILADKGRHARAATGRLTVFDRGLTFNLRDFLSGARSISDALTHTVSLSWGWRSLKPSALPARGGLFWMDFAMLRRSRRPTSHEGLLKTHVQEAARLRNLAASVTTAPLRSRLLEEAGNQERLAQQLAATGANELHHTQSPH